MDFRKSLIDDDPLAREPGLDAFHAQAMRQRVLLEARIAERDGESEREGVLEREGFSRASASSWLRPTAMAAALAACLVAGVGIGLRINTADVSGVERPLQGRGQIQGRRVPPRQLQFATPGGTRIIWTFHQEIDL